MVLVGGVVVALFAGFSTVQAQVVVSVRPNRPAVVVVKPTKVKKGYVWREGYWKYNRRSARYVWVKAGWIKKKRGMVWVPGQWKQVPKGWIWVEGRWRRA